MALSDAEEVASLSADARPRRMLVIINPVATRRNREE